jgi:hypothetical protein
LAEEKGRLVNRARPDKKKQHIRAGKMRESKEALGLSHLLLHLLDNKPGARHSEILKNFLTAHMGLDVV